MRRFWQQNVVRYGVAVGGIALLTAMLEPFHAQLSPTTIALALLLVVLFTATFIGRNPALFASVVATLCFNYFFLPPVRTWTISDSQNWIAWAAFSLTAITAGELSAKARRRAIEAERGKQEIEKLYQELQTAFEQASHTEALRQSEQLKSALLDAVTHDIRTPLTSIKAAVTSLLDDDSGDFQLDTEGRKEFLEIINEEADRLNHFTEGMIELARLEAHDVQLRRTWSSVEEILSAALERAQSQLKHHRTRVELEAEMPTIRVNAKALAEVVYTLLDNAAKYAPPNSLIKITAQRGAHDVVEIAVVDEGNGIPLELRERVFEKFFRATLEPKEKLAVGGSGLGLAIARGIVESHGGRIWITEGEQQRGTRIAFTVPIGDEEA